jgi:hypothetical protein
VAAAELACFLGCNHFAALVLTAFAADAMGQLAFMAVRALRGADRGQEVVAATLRGALFGMAAFRIRHCCSLSIGPAHSDGARLQGGPRNSNKLVLPGFDRAGQSRERIPPGIR